MTKLWLILLLTALASAQYPKPGATGAGGIAGLTQSFAGTQNTGTDVVCALHADVIAGLTCNNQVTDGTTTTAFASTVSIPAGTMSANTTAVNLTFGYVGTSGAPSMIVSIKLGSAVVFTSGNMAGNSNTVGGIYCALTAGSAASATTPVIVGCVNTGTFTAINRNTLLTTAAKSIAVDTTVAQTLTVTVIFGANTAGNALWLYGIAPGSGGAVGAAGPVGPLAPTTLVFGLPLTGASFPAARKYAAAAGDVDVYTAPPAKRVLVMSGGGYNPTGGTINWYAELKSGGNYYRLATSVATTTHNSVSANMNISIVLEPGESISVNTDALGLNVVFSVVQFDSTSPLRTAKLLGLSTGNNTLYTVPAAKTAWLLPITGQTWNATSTFSWVSDAGGSRTVQMCAVASGGLTTCAANSVNQINSVGAVAANVRTNSLSMPLTFNTGDFFVVNVDTGAATQLAWTNVLEF